MLSAKKFPCNTTRCFDPKIHPKRQVWDAITFRLQWRKHERISVEDVANVLKIVDWKELFSQPRQTSIKGNTGVSTWRILPAGEKMRGGLKRTYSLSTGKEFLLLDTPRGKLSRKTGRIINPDVIVSQLREKVKEELERRGDVINRTDHTNSTDNTRLR